MANDAKIKIIKSDGSVAWMTMAEIKELRSKQGSVSESGAAPMNQIPPSTPEQIAPPQVFVNLPRAKKEPEARAEKPSKMSYGEMKEQIDNQFKKDQSGQFMNISEVLRELERLAAKYEDDHIRDLYLYNEKDARFEWNNILINTK